MQTVIEKIDPCKNCGASPNTFKLKYSFGYLIDCKCAYCGSDVDLPWKKIYLEYLKSAGRLL